MSEEIKTRIVCDRCGKTVEGMEAVQNNKIESTGGYYKRRGWGNYMNDDEGIVCDDCMHSDPRYAKDYPTATGEPRKPKERTFMLKLETVVITEVEVFAKDADDAKKIINPLSYMNHRAGCRAIGGEVKFVNIVGVEETLRAGKEAIDNTQRIGGKCVNSNQ